MAPEPVPFGRYRLLNLLGEGGMAKVYRALLSGPMGFEKEVALKRIDSKLTEDERVVKALINEARLGGQLRHKNIVEIYEFNQVSGNYFMAMEYVDGWTLDHVLKGCRIAQEMIPPAVIVEIFINVARGLDYAHTLVSKEGQPLNLVHRDLKPGNIIASRDGDVKIMDFGIAKADTNLYKTTAADVTKGTPIYMSPEQVTGSKLDGRSDIFSLGSILHEMVTLQVPFYGDNLLAIMHAILSADITEARERVASMAPAIEPVMAKCMAKDPKARYQHVKELAAALKEIRHQLPPGPTLTEWIEDFANRLPSPTATGEFGPDGAPIAMHGKPAQGTQSLAALERTTEEPVAQPAVSVGDDASFDSFGATLAVLSGSVDVDETLDTHEQAFFSTDDRKTPSADLQRTRLQGRSVPGSAPPRRRRRKKKKTSRAVLWLALVALFVVVGAGGIAMFKLGATSSTKPVTTTDPTPEVVADPTPEPGDGLDSLSLSQPTPAPVEPATHKEPRTPRPVAKTEPKTERPPKTERTPTAVAPVEPTPAPVTEATPVPAGTGKVNLNSKPWSTVIVDGRALGSSPIIGHELPAGPHTVVFDCSACDPPDKMKVSVEVRPGQTTKKIVHFDKPD